MRDYDGFDRVRHAPLRTEMNTTHETSKSGPAMEMVNLAAIKSLNDGIRALADMANHEPGDWKKVKRLADSIAYHIADAETPAKCAACGGSGEIAIYVRRDGVDVAIDHMAVCPTCNGVRKV
jgi:hypothetical protein